MVERVGQLRNPPLFFVLTSIRFQALEQLPKWVPEIQDKLRDRFPLFGRLSQTLTPGGVVINFGANQGPDVSDDSASAWTFSSADRYSGCQLFKNNLVLYTRQYVTFDEFLNDVNFALEALLDSARHIDVDYIGVRYLDAITATPERPLRDYVPAELLPWENQWAEGVETLGGNALSTYGIGEDRVNVRFRTGQEQLKMPEDLLALYISTIDMSKPASNAAFEVLQAKQGVLDTDSIWNAALSIKMSKDEIVQTLERLHDHANRLFRSVCSEAAFIDWQQTK